MGSGIYGALKTDAAALFPARWYFEEGDREHYRELRVALVGSLDRRTGYPVQNMRASTKGTIIRVSQPLPIQERQEFVFLGMWWLVDEVRYDLTAVNPQAAGAGDIMKNALVEVVLIGSGRVAE